MMTGDLVDYVFEENDSRKGGGNYMFFRQLVCGQAKSPDGHQNAELLVPFFSTLGNHDYRPNRYAPLFEVDLLSAVKTSLPILNSIIDASGNIVVTAVAPAVEIGTDVWDIAKDSVVNPKEVLSDVYELGADVLDGIGSLFSYFTSHDAPKTTKKEISQFNSLNLTYDEVYKLLGKPVFSPSGALAMSDADEHNEDHSRDYYFKYINRSSSYSVKLDEHRLVMIDSKYDKDIIDTVSESFRQVTGTGTEGENHYANGGPDSVGFDVNDCALLKNALTEAGQNLVIVGVHAPVLNPIKDQYPYFFRESLRSGTTHFAEEKGDDILDNGTSKGLSFDFLKLAAGVNVNRPVDLVLSGHVHKNWECRMKWNNGNFRFFSDFYTENPEFYYSTLLNVGDHKNMLALPPQESKSYLTTLPANKVHISIDKNATNNEVPQMVISKNPETGKDRKYYLLKTKPNPNTLNNSADPKQWFSQHRPLFIQTSGSGPLDYSQRMVKPEDDANPSFQGWRLIRIENNTITRINNVLMHDARKAIESPITIRPLTLA